MAGQTKPLSFKTSDIDTDMYCLDLDDSYSNIWTDEDDNNVASFQDGETYWFAIQLWANEGYEFKESYAMKLSKCLLQVRGIDWEEVCCYSDVYGIYFWGKITYHKATGIPKGNAMPATDNNTPTPGNKTPGSGNNVVSGKDNSNTDNGNNINFT